MNNARRSGGRNFQKRPPFPSISHSAAGPLLKVAAWVALVMFLLGLPLLIMRIKFPLQIGQGEAVNVEYALNLLKGQPLYQDPSHAPYLYIAYPPLYPWLGSKLMGFIHNLWAPGRLLAFAGYFGCGILLGTWGWRRWGWERALFLASLFGTFQTWALWGTMNRGDTLSIFFCFASFLSLYSLELEEDQGRGKGTELKKLALAGSLSALAILTKQNALELVLVYGLYCLFKGYWRKLAVYSIFCLLPVTLLFGWEQYTSGGFFLKRIFVWLDTGTNLDSLRYYLAHYFLREGGILCLGLIWVFSVKRLNALLKWQVLFTVLALAAFARVTSAENYLLGFLLFGTLVLGEGYSAPFRSSFRRKVDRYRLLGSPLVGLFFLVLFWASTVTMRWPGLPGATEINMKFNAMEQFKKPGDHLALDLDLLVMAGKPIWVQPAEYKAMVDKGTWDPSPLLRDIRTRKFSTIELYDTPEQFLLPQVVVEEISRNYHPFLHEYGRVWMAPNAT